MGKSQAVDVTTATALQTNLPSSFQTKLTRSAGQPLPRHRMTAPTASYVFTEWKTVISLEVEKLISSSSNKTCQLDPAPTWLIKVLRSLLSPFIALLFNKSLPTGCFPKKYKHAIVFSLPYSKRTIWTLVRRKTLDQFLTCHICRSYT